jgi:transcriptional regulator with XRE-family HTH domain
MSGKEFKLARNLKRLIGEKGISYNELARRSGVPKTNLLNWSEGANPQVDQLLKVADVLEVSLDFLVASRKEEIDLDKILDKVSVHIGMYEVSIKKVSKK